MKLISSQMENLQTWESANACNAVSRQTVVGQVQNLHDLHKFGIKIKKKVCNQHMQIANKSSSVVTELQYLDGCKRSCFSCDV